MCFCFSARKANTAHNGGCDPLLTSPLEDPKVAWATGALDEPMSVAMHVSVSMSLPGMFFMAQLFPSLELPNATR